LQLGRYNSTGYIKDVAKTKRALWYNKVEEWQYPQFNTVIETMKDHYEPLNPQVLQLSR
jgi:TPP-dependent 2-oxoacid decarboxylase